MPFKSAYHSKAMNIMTVFGNSNRTRLNNLFYIAVSIINYVYCEASGNSVGDSFGEIGSIKFSISHNNTPI